MRILALTFLVVFSCVNAFAADEPVCSSTSGNAALVIIDMQPGFSELNGQHVRPENVAKMAKLIEEQKKAIKEAQAAGIPIVFIEYDTEGFMHTGATSPELIGAATKNYRDVRVFKKTTDGLFEKKNKYLKEINEFIKREQIGTLIIAGANGGACVQRSIKGALQNNCNVVAYSNGIADFNFKDFIYPYAGRYGDMKKLEKDCSNCSFKELASVDSVANSMISNKSRSSINGGSKSSGNSTKSAR